MLKHLGEICELHFPRKIRLNLREYLIKAGHYTTPYEKIGISFIGAIIFNIIVYIFFILPGLKTISTGILLIFLSIIVFVISYYISILLSGVALYVYFEISIYKRTIEIEEVLPNFLQEVSVNLRAGMTFDKALRNSVEPEFGVLEKEIEIVAKKVMSGEDTETALLEFANKYNSPLLRESMDLIVIGLKSGGQISDLIDRVVFNVQEASYLKKELIANVTSYIIFITLVAIIIAPTLFALSFNLMQIIQSLGEKLMTSGAQNLVAGFSFGGSNVDPNDFIKFSRYSIVIIAIASSMIIADLREGNIKGGIKYIFIFIFVAFFVYEIMLKVFIGMFGSIV